MKHTFLRVTLVLLMSCITPSLQALEVTNSGMISDSGSTSLAPALNLGKLEVTDTMHLSIGFSSPVQMETLKLKITKQGDSSAIKIASMTGSTISDSLVVITLETELQPGSVYTLTAVSAIGRDGSLIKDGALALKDFVTPIPLKSPEPILSAAPNPNAILVKTGVTTPPVPTSSPAVTPAVTKIPDKPQGIIPVKELPLTGMNPFFLLIVILPLAFFFLRRKVV